MWNSSTGPAPRPRTGQASAGDDLKPGDFGGMAGGWELKWRVTGAPLGGTYQRSVVQETRRFGVPRSFRRASWPSR